MYLFWISESDRVWYDGYCVARVDGAENQIGKSAGRERNGGDGDSCHRDFDLLCVVCSTIKILQVRVEIIGPEHPDTLRAMSNLASTYVSLGRLEDGLNLQELSMEGQRRTLGALHHDTLNTMTNLGETYRQLGRPDSSITLLEKSSAGWRETLGSEHPNTLWSMNLLGVSYFDAGRFDDSVALWETAVERRTKSLGEDDPNTRFAIKWLEVARQGQREGISIARIEANANVALKSSTIKTGKPRKERKPIWPFNKYSRG